jgi:hypothetical protein
MEEECQMKIQKALTKVSMRNRYYKILLLLILLLWVVPVPGQTPTRSVTLCWDPNTEADLAGYKIYYGTASRDEGGYAIPNFHDTILAGTETYTFPELAYGTYYFSLTAFDLNGNESKFSNEVSAELSGLDLNIQLAWDPNTETDLAGYKIYHGTASREEGGYAKPNFYDIIPAGTETYIMVAPGDGIHYFSLTAYDTAGNESEFSNEVWTVLPTFEPPYSEGIPIVIDMNGD